ncbi:hypothetical protein FQZ97_1270650 [compost metagenome]
MYPGAGDLHVRAIAQGFTDQAVELRVAEALPPIAFWPRGRRQRDTVQGLPGLEALGLETDAFGLQAAVAGTARQAHGQDHQA